MALDSRQKRMAAMNPGCAWRGPMVDASSDGFGQGNRAAALFLYSGVDEQIIIPQIPPMGPVGRVFDNVDPPTRKLPPPRRRRRRRREAPVPEKPPLTPQEIEAEERARLERVASRFASDGDRAAVDASRAMVGLPDPAAIARAPTVDWDAIANQLVSEQQRLRDEEEAEILLMAM